jgi:hypothetical protein
VKRFLSTIIALFLPLFVYSITINEIDENEDGIIDQWIEMINDNISKVILDRDFDGEPDYFILYDEDANKIEEALDYNFDGEMDDFYYYENDVMIRREIDSNYDGFVDIYVYLYEGVYIKKIERDTDYDGEIDFIKDYGSAGI